MIRDETSGILSAGLVFFVVLAAVVLFMALCSGCQTTSPHLRDFASQSQQVDRLVLRVNHCHYVRCRAAWLCGTRSRAACRAAAPAAQPCCTPSRCSLICDPCCRAPCE